MEIETLKKLIKKHEASFIKSVDDTKVAERYYANQNDIVTTSNPLDKKNDSNDNPLRNADNRISHAYFPLLQNQKASYAMSIPPTFDVGGDEMNDNIVKLLGNHYAKVAKDLCIKAGNAGNAWVHVWKDEKNGFFKYAVVDSKQIIPIYSNRLGDEVLEGLLRIYADLTEDGTEIIVYEYWNDTECQTFYKEKEQDDIQEYSAFQVIDTSTGEATGETNTYSHDWGLVPFIKFANNTLETSDLSYVKSLIDVYDKVFSGFVNDVDDIQEIIFILTNYSGEDKQEFLNDMNKYKMIKIENDEPGDKSGVETLAIDIPIEARVKILEITRDAIFVQGQGVDPQKNISQNNSGVALKHMYSLLELKASMLETEFREGFADLIKFILIYYNADPDIIIEQTWTRTSINDELEKAQIIKALANETSQETIAKNNPLVSRDGWQDELEALKNEEYDSDRMIGDYKSDVTDVDIDD